VLKFNSVRKTYNENIVAVDNVSLDIPKGEFCVILGPSGAGKSTLLRLANGMSMPDEGSVEFDGKKVNKKNLKFIQPRIGMIHQQLHLVQRLSVLNNVLSGTLPLVSTWLSMFRCFSLQYKRKACSLLEQVELEEVHLYRRASHLSGGQQQRVAIARAFILEPDLVLADEPVASLDPVISRGVLRLLKKASRQHNSTVLCSLHQVEYALEIADRVIGLQKGRIVFDGAPEELTSDVLGMIYDNVPGTEDESMVKESFSDLIFRRTLLDPSVKVEVLVS